MIAEENWQKRNKNDAEPGTGYPLLFIIWIE